MDRSPATSLLNTLALGLLLIGTPLWLVTRLASAIFPLAALDLVVVTAVVTWLIVVKAIANRNHAIDSRHVNRTSPAWLAGELVDNSLLGFGFDAESTPTGVAPKLHLLAQPRVLAKHELAPALPTAEFVGGLSGRPMDGVGPTSVSVLQSAKPVTPSVVETHEYIVARRDTFWSIAEVVLGDGRDWQQLQELNLGRQVAPDVVLTSKHELRIGWSILLPVITQTNSELQGSDHVA